MRDDEVGACVDFLERGPLLAAIQEERLDRRELEQRFDVSRTTVYRATVDLEERGLIEQTDGGYRLTSHGRGITAAVDQYHNSLAAVDRLGPLLEYVDHPILLRSLHLFEECEVLTADPGEPYWLTEWLTERMAEADFFRGLDPIMGNARLHEVAVERVEAGADVASVIDRERVSEWGEATPERLAETKRRLGKCNLYVCDDVPFTLQIFDETVVVVGLDDDTGIPAVCAVTDRPMAQDGAKTLFHRYQREAEPIEIDELPA